MQVKLMKLFPPQQDVIQSGMLSKSEHCLLNMATGSGKTFLSEIAIENVLAQGYKAIYVTPLRALATQQHDNYQKRFAGYRVGVFTGETVQSKKAKTSYQNTQLLIMTPERLDACMRNWHTHWGWIPEVSLIVIDEFHILGQDQRGARLEGTITRFIRLNPFVKIIGLSATMPNVRNLADWLQGTFYQSSWRQVPLEKRIVRFKAAKDKPEMLLEEVRRCINAGGQSLVFCNSRSRVQGLMEYLKENGINADCHHAGLLPEERSKTENEFRSKAIQVLVSTSTLEMGLNLPARQVVIYDSYSYTDNGFSALPVWSFMQRAGRAGRPGLDPSGEIVLMLPKWESGANRYLEDECEPVFSQLTNPKTMTEQILIDVHSGFSRTRRELQEGFLPLTLYRHEHSEATIAGLINKLVLSNMLIEGKDDNDKEEILKVGLLGRMAVKLMFSPETIKMARDATQVFGRLYIFDALLLATMSEDCSPILQVNYEEMDSLCDTVQQLPSKMMDITLAELKQKMPGTPGTIRMLAAIKMAAICYRLTQGDESEDIADDFDLYEADIRMLQESTIRVLTGMSAIYTAIDRSNLEEEQREERKKDHTRPAAVCSMVANMLQYEITSDLVTLTQIRGIGGTLAKRLAENGYATIQSIADAVPGDLSAIDGIGKKLAKSAIEDAQKLVASGEIQEYEEEAYDDLVRVRDVETSIDPYRLRRSLELIVRGHEAGKFCISGGREDHIVLIRNRQYSCDCLDYEKNEGKCDCKHILCVKRAKGNREIMRMVKLIREDKEHSIRESLPTMWFSMTQERRR